MYFSCYLDRLFAFLPPPWRDIGLLRSSRYAKHGLPTVEFLGDFFKEEGQAQRRDEYLDFQLLRMGRSKSSVKKSDQ